MHRSIAVIFTASLFGLAGCTQSADVAAESTSASAESTETTSSAAAEAEFAEVGDTIEVACDYEGCNGEFELEEILFGGECLNPLVSEEMEGMKLLQIRGTVSATKRIDDAMGNEIGAQLETPETWNAEKFKSTADATGSCAEPQGYEWWSTPARTDEKVRVYGAFWVPEDSEVLGIAHSKIDSTAAEEGVADAPAPEPAPAVAPAPAPAPAPVQPEADPVIGFTEAPGVAQPTAMNKTISHCGDPGLHETGTTFFTDGTSGWTQTCASQMM